MKIINNSRRKVFTLALIILVLLFAACSVSNPVSASEILSVTSKLNCVCGNCDELLSECNCETATKLTGIVKKGLSRGQSEEEIVQNLVRQYGQQVLAENP
ncbi:MAG: cytochrome c-type biogenesis protein CcmH [Dehalococcoidales bacterium]|nr:cytochrome c-type biogenesis protein CcmH [Dehalococcoidales bacterium]